GLLGTVLSGTSLRTQIRKVPLLVAPIAQATDHDPMRALQRRGNARAQHAGLHPVCVVGGLAYYDGTRARLRPPANHDDDHAPAAAEVLQETIADIEAHAAEFVGARDDPATAVRRAAASTRSPVNLVDVADNVGGGTPGDGTALL